MDAYDVMLGYLMTRMHLHRLYGEGR